MTDKELNAELAEIKAQVGALGRALAILTASLHVADVVNGNGVAATLRLDRTNNSHADKFTCEIADLIRRTIEVAENEGPATLRSGSEL